MMQGDSYGVAIDIFNAEKIAITAADVSDVEVTIGFIRKSYSTGGVTYEHDRWLVHLAQEDTFSILPSKVKVQIRVKWPDGSVEGVDLGYKNIQESLSKEVL